MSSYDAYFTAQRRQQLDVPLEPLLGAGEKAVTVTRIEFNAWKLAEEVCAKDCVVESLQLFDCHMGPHGATMLGKALQANTSLTELNLSYNEVGDDGVTALGQALQVNTSLTKLNLHNSNVGDTGRVVLRAANDARQAMREWLTTFNVRHAVCLLVLRITGAPWTHVCLNILQFLAVPPELSILM